MKRSLKILASSIAALASFSLPVYSQGLINNGAYIVNNGAYIIVTGLTGHFLNQDAGASIGKVNNTGVMQVAGNWTNNSSQNVFTANTGLVEMNGSSQIFGGTTVTWFNNLSLLGSANKTLNQSEIVGGGYAAPAGVLALNDRPLLLTNRRLTITNPLNTAITRTTGYIVSEQNVAVPTSIVQWNVGATNAVYVFPFGTVAAPNYIPLTITKTGGNTNITVSTRQTLASNNLPWHVAVTQMFSQTIPGAGEVPVVIDRWWDIKSVASFTGAVSFTYRGVENTTTYAPAGTFSAQNWVGTSWSPPVGAGPGVVGAVTAAVSIPAQTLGTTTPWVLSNLNAPLPIELLYFNAKLNGKVVYLDWSTASEINNAFFEVQRSRDNESFETFDVVNGAGNSTTVVSYKDVDQNPYDGISYYRLRQVDYDGKYSFSQSVPVRIGNEKAFDFIFASPDNYLSGLTLGYYSNVEEPIVVLISDAVGNKIFSATYPSVNGFNKKEIPLPQLSAAVYFVTLSNSSKTVTKKFFMN